MPDLKLALALLLLAFGLASAVAFRRALASAARRCRDWYAAASADEPAAVLGGPLPPLAVYKVEAAPAAYAPERDARRVLARRESWEGRHSWN